MYLTSFKKNNSKTCARQKDMCLLLHNSSRIGKSLKRLFQKVQKRKKLPTTIQNCLLEKGYNNV